MPVKFTNSRKTAYLHFKNRTVNYEITHKNGAKFSVSEYCRRTINCSQQPQCVSYEGRG